MNENIGIVTIGRNEGDRLIRCFESLKQQLAPDMPIVYVDSGSTDGSVEKAQEMGIEVVNLDMTQPFTMARGRNAGFQYMLTHHPDLEFVQFIDGDCELLPGWLDTALEFIQKDPQIAIVCGRRKERFPEASPYNRMAELEWNTLVGETTACGGDALMRVAAIQDVGGYDPSLICGEEPEMCIRLRRQGWRIWRLDADMTLHDAAMLRFGQWWKRSIRGGWAVAEGFDRYGQADEQYMQREHKSGWLWGLGIPLLTLGCIWPTHGISLLLLFFYGLLGFKIYRYRTNTYDDTPSDARLYAFYCNLSKFPQMIGQAKYWLNRLRNKPATLIEYKESPASPSGT
ncbi:glycosyltransferase [Oscillatoria sp. CS-180]|uniref:glycosyltransferase family 2 protein n=1 Tax=Oscillatoria sp. CS-180 TaxID=3021720 RepID=UPI00232AD624|nr:glycosyltransferase [Oscillatoria sp. CS-180]MDB9528200.1 glycosyltransferase [Oscillatoria sp. CS-180]